LVLDFLSAYEVSTGDKITSWSPYQRSPVSAVSFEEYCLKESFGDEPRLPETLCWKFLQLGTGSSVVVGF